MACMELLIIMWCERCLHDLPDTDKHGRQLQWPATPITIIQTEPRGLHTGVCPHLPQATVWPRCINFACGGPLRSFELWVRRSHNMIMKSACPTCVLQRCHAGRKLPMTRHVVGLGLQRWRCGQGPHPPGHRQRPLAPAGCVLFPYHDVTLIWRGRTLKMKWN